MPKPGETRAVQSFDIRFSTLAEASVDILFSKCKVTPSLSIAIAIAFYVFHGQLKIPVVFFSLSFSRSLFRKQMQYT